MLEQQAKQIAAAMDSAFVVTLGGQPGSKKQWGQCLAVKVDSSLAQIRSSLGNALAQASADQGLRAIAVVAYIEVHQLRFTAVCMFSCRCVQVDCLCSCVWYI